MACGIGHIFIVRVENVNTRYDFLIFVLSYYGFKIGHIGKEKGN